MIPHRFHIRMGVLLKLDGVSHLSIRSFGLGSPIGLEYLSLVLSLRDDT